MKYIVANWKANKNTQEVKDWAAQFSTATAQLKAGQLTVVICPSFVHLPLLPQLLPGVSLGTQTVSPFGNGAYSGSVTALMASEWASYSIVGHSERRQYFAETNPVVAQQAIQALDSKMTPIIGVDQKNWASQLSQLDKDQLAKCLVMYEPPEAISTHKGAHAAQLEDVKQALQLIKSEFKVKGVLYGGSVNEANAAEYFSEPLVDGAVIGAASLDAKTFSSIIEIAAHSIA